MPTLQVQKAFWCISIHRRWDDLSGIKLIEFKNAESNLKIDFSNYDEGIYFINMVNISGNKIVYKILKY